MIHFQSNLPCVVHISSGDEPSQARRVIATITNERSLLMGGTTWGIQIRDSTGAKQEERAAVQLPPPPPASPQLSEDNHHRVPFLPCSSFQLRSPKGNDKKRMCLKDPFPATYMECTKSVRERKERENHGARLGLSCKNKSDEVTEDAIERLSQFRVVHRRGF